MTEATRVLAIDDDHGARALPRMILCGAGDEVVAVEDTALGGEVIAAVVARGSAVMPLAHSDFCAAIVGNPGQDRTAA